MIGRMSARPAGRHVVAHAGRHHDIAGDPGLGEFVKRAGLALGRRWLSHPTESSVSLMDRARPVKAGTSKRV